MPLSPQQFAVLYQSRLRSRYNGSERALKQQIDRLKTNLFFTMPTTAWLALTGPVASSATISRNTVDGQFYRIGYFQTAAGPIHSPQLPNPDRFEPYNDWGRIANQQQILTVLGRPGTMSPTAWPTAIEDQVAIGLINYHENLLQMHRMLGQVLGILNWGSQWTYVLAILSFKNNPEWVVALMQRYSYVLARTAENARFGTLVHAFVVNGPATTEEAIALLEVWDFLESGFLLAASMNLSEEIDFYAIFRGALALPVAEIVDRLTAIAGRASPAAIQPSSKEFNGAAVTPQAAQKSSSTVAWIGAGAAAAFAAWLLLKK